MKNLRSVTLCIHVCICLPSAQSGGTIFSPGLSFPRNGVNSVSASQAAIHLLACLSNLNEAIASGVSLTGPDGLKVEPGTRVGLGASVAKQAAATDYVTACRFISEFK